MRCCRSASSRRILRCAMWCSWRSIKSRSSEHTARQTLATSRAGTKDNVRALSSSGKDRKPSVRDVRLFEIGSNGAKGAELIGRNARVGEPEPIVGGAVVAPVASTGAPERLWIWLMFVFWPPRIVRTMGRRPSETFADDETWSRLVSYGRAGLLSVGCCVGGLMDVCEGSTSMSMSMEDENDMACGVELFANDPAH